MNGETPLIRNIGRKVITAATAAALQTALDTWFEGADQKRLLRILEVDALTVLILYTE